MGKLVRDAFVFLCFAIISQVVALCQVANPTIAGIPVHCVDPTGQIVYSVLNRSINDVAISTIDVKSGLRLIIINPTRFATVSPLFQLFIYAHECGHHVSGDVVQGVYLRHDNINRERTADRIGIRFLRDQLNINENQARSLAAMFANNPPMWPYYLPGPLRAQWIVDCYLSTDDNCTKSGTPQSHASAAEGQSAQGDFCTDLKTVMENAPESFSKFKGRKTDTDEWSSTKVIEGLSSCSVYGSGTDAYFSCRSTPFSDAAQADSSFEDFKAKTRSCLGKGWTAQDKTNKNGNPFTRYEKDGETSYIEVEERTKTTGGLEVDVDVQLEP